MVDEFQDTNPLQNELLELLERDNLFRVGDENQSIYGFRNADVGVFRDASGRGGRRRARAARIADNFRSRGEVLDAIDLGLRARRWGTTSSRCARRPGSREPARVSPSVELLVTDRSKRAGTRRGARALRAAMHGAPPGAPLEARLLAQRIDELAARTGRSSPATWRCCCGPAPHVAVRAALAERGVPTYVAGGRGYWSQQQVADLRALARRRSPTRSTSSRSTRVLGSPLVGASLDAVALDRPARARAAAATPWWTLAATARAATARAARRAAGRRRAHRGRSSRASWPSAGRPAPVARDADRPRGDRHRATTAPCSRCRAASGGWRTCAS